ncbi:hypothetical protein B4589_010210 [Halolamina sp. CBA1230]|uniref:hypothetical protein n=1 Tax=Halolamina sp. CBA1230 TaxID=1853690 RepID=UPI0015938EA0|nr:hypothetical protein [Halolamina sp. CBA1230]QKY20734.1 hypothetical protein B4589_010210 [Halolamina sp. CBA1230]
MLLQLPGGPELLIILLVMALLVGVPVVLLGVFLFVRFVTGGGDSDEVAELKGRIEELEAQVAAGDEAASNEVSVEDEGSEAGKRRERSEQRETASEASREERPASSDDDGGDR